MVTQTKGDSLVPPMNKGRMLLSYIAMLVGTAILFAILLHFGQRLDAPSGSAAPATPHAAAAHSSTLAQVLLAIAVITVSARFVAHVFNRYLGQPPVMGEIVAGIVLGPSVLGALVPQLTSVVLPQAIAPHLGILSKIGVVIFMFLVGLELDTKLLRGSSHATLAISHASIVAPFLLGATLALGLYPIYANAGTGFTVFALFLGVSMSVTAFPVLARILTGRGLSRTQLGMTAIACAAIDDATAWCLLALVSGVATAQLGNAAITIGLVALYLIFMFVVARPIAYRLAEREGKSREPVSQGVLAVVFGMMLLSSYATESIGIHALFGAFLFGAMIPHDGRLTEQLRERLEDVVVVLLLPMFFASTGLRTQIGLVSTPMDWAITALIVLVATLGKFGGSAVAARFAGIGLRESSALGILMNTRGLMELIVLNVGLDMSVLSPRLFAMLVIMALVTTFTTTPILNLVLRGHPLAQAGNGPFVVAPK